MKRLYPHHGGYYATKLMLAEMLKDGELDARAGQRWISDRSSLDAAWRARDEEEVEEDVLLEPDDFEWSRFWNEDLAKWRWKENRFVLTRTKRNPLHLFLVDVSFRSSQVREMLPSNRRNIGGRTIRAADVAKLAIALIELAKQGYFTAAAPGSDAPLPRFKDRTDLVSKTLGKSDESYGRSQAYKILGPVYGRFYPQTE